MNKLQQVILAISVLALGAVILGLAYNRSKNSITARTYRIGQELIATTNSPHLTSLRPGLSGQLSNLLGSPTRVAAVLLGDEPSPLGDGTACARLTLTNQLGDGLKLRLGQIGDPEKLQILGYWPLGQQPLRR